MLQRLTIARAQLEEEAERLRVRHAELEKRLAQFDADMERERRILEDNAGVLSRLASEKETLEGEEAGHGAREAAAREALDLAGATLEASEATLQRLTGERAEALAARGQAERSIREAGEREARLIRQLADAERETADIAARLAGLPDPAEKRRLVAEAEAAAGAAEAAATEAERAVAAARARETAARPPVEQARAALAGIETEARTLAKILNAASGGLFPAVLEQVKVVRGYEAALGAALGEDLDAPTDRSAPAHWGEVAPQDGDPALPEGVEPLSARVSAPAALARRLAQIGVVRDEDGASLQARLRPGQRLVSLRGALWRWDGFTASAEAPTAAAQRLAQKNRLAELDAEASQARSGLDEVSKSLLAAEAAVRASADGEKSARQAWRDAQARVGEAREALSRAERAAGDLAARRAAATEAHARVGESLAEARSSLAEARAALESAPDPLGLQDAFDRASVAVAADRGRLSEARSVRDGLLRESETRRRRLAAIASETESWTSRAANAEAQIASLSDRRGETAAEAEGLADAPDELDAKRRALLSQLSEAETLRRAAADRLQEAENRQAALDKAANEAIQNLSSAREARARAEERLTAADERRRDAEARIAETLQCAPHHAFRQTGLAPDDPLPDVADTERRLDRLKVERERLGAVNLRAEEESRELSERLETIVSEREDVIEAIKALRQGIQSLNREGRERLLAAFDVVDGHFRRLFTHLFGGGTAELQLIESEDPLEAGLEILARPPGKKPQTMTLLSGGEQALTAMALIFAVFLTNPAPICVLDEVDAPLDDHNVERFCNLMDEMAATTDTRFVIITHNPITMARMNRLFGVTMAEQGVSQLVSVDLQAAEALREAS